jgi:Family of unknown function (DUF6535)
MCVRFLTPNSLPYSITLVHCLQAGLFATALSAFVVNSLQNLQPSPAQETAYYMQQNVAILAQISKQISSIAPQVTIPSTPPPPFPTFTPRPSDVRVNVFWFMSLVFSLCAALLAILVQQWVRNYMHVFQRYHDPLKLSRLRQYLHERFERWHIPVLADAVPALLHVSIFLFFAGLIDFTLNLNTTVAAYTIVPIGISGLFYVFTTLSPVLIPQSPYQNSFSEVIWYLIQKLRARHYKDRAGQSKPLSTNMAAGQMELAMEETPERKGRDERAILWLVKSMTEDAEIESFAMAIPGSFNTDWGVDVWQGVSDLIEDEKSGTKDNSPNTPTPPASTFHRWLDPVLRFVRVRGANHHHHTGLSHYSGSSSTLGSMEPNQGMHELSKRVGYLLGTCNDPGHFPNHKQWHQRTRACVETTAELIFRGKSHLDWFGDISKVLRDVAEFEKIRELTASKMDQSFVSRWTCLSILAIEPTLSHHLVKVSMEDAVSNLANVDLQGHDGTVDDLALQAAARIDEDFKQALESLLKLYSVLFLGPELTEAQVRERLSTEDSRHQIAELERINGEADRMQYVDKCIYEAWRNVNGVTQKLTSQLPGIQFDDILRDAEPPSFGEALHFLSISPKPLSVLPWQHLRGLCSIFPKLRDIVESRNAREHRGTLESLKSLVKATDRYNRGLIMESQLARWQDLRDGGGLGVAVELFFITLGKVLPTSTLEVSHHDLYIGAFKSITYEWEKCKNSHGTQKVVLDVAFDLTMRLPELVIPLDTDFDCPEDFKVCLLGLVGNMLEGQTGPHIDEAVDRLRDVRRDSSGERRKFAERALEVINPHVSHSHGPVSVA